MENSVLYNFCYKLELFRVERSVKHKHEWLNKTICFNLLKAKAIHKIPPETVQKVFLSNMFMTSCISLSSTN